MSKDEIQLKVITMIGDEVLRDIGEISSGDTFSGDLDMDNTQFLGFISNIEEEFEIKISDADIDRLWDETVDCLVNFICAGGCF